MRFRLAVYHTTSANKYNAEMRHEYFGDADSIWHLWFHFARQMNFQHVEVYSLDGQRIHPEKGLNAMTDYTL